MSSISIFNNKHQVSIFLDFLARLRVSELLLFSAHQANQTVLFHFSRSFVTCGPDIFEILAIETSHCFPFEHVILSSSLKLILFPILPVEALQTALGLAYVVTERRIRRS